MATSNRWLGDGCASTGEIGSSSVLLLLLQQLLLQSASEDLVA
jgi:hypothetical protein